MYVADCVVRFMPADGSRQTPEGNSNQLGNYVGELAKTPDFITFFEGGRWGRGEGLETGGRGEGGMGATLWVCLFVIIF